MCDEILDLPAQEAVDRELFELEDLIRRLQEQWVRCVHSGEGDSVALVRLASL